MRCSSCEPLLDAYLETSLGQRQGAQVAAHLRSCVGCSALLAELRVIDALLATASSPGSVASNFTASVVSATRGATPRSHRRIPLWPPLVAYLATAWALFAFAAFRGYALRGLISDFAASEQRSLAALGAALRALAPATPLAAAAVTGVLLIDLLLLCAIFYGYHRLQPAIALYLRRGSRS
jgi:anti-sigma factor RsiW